MAWSSEPAGPVPVFLKTCVVSDQPSASAALCSAGLYREHEGSSHCRKMTFLPLGAALLSGSDTWMSVGGVVGGASTVDLLPLSEDSAEAFELEPESPLSSLPQAAVPSASTAPRQTSS